MFSHLDLLGSQYSIDTWATGSRPTPSRPSTQGYRGMEWAIFLRWSRLGCKTDFARVTDKDWDCVIGLTHDARCASQISQPPPHPRRTNAKAAEELHSEFMRNECLSLLPRDVDERDHLPMSSSLGDIQVPASLAWLISKAPHPFRSLFRADKSMTSRLRWMRSSYYHGAGLATREERYTLPAIMPPNSIDGALAKITVFQMAQSDSSASHFARASLSSSLRKPKLSVVSPTGQRGNVLWAKARLNIRPYRSLLRLTFITAALDERDSYMHLSNSSYAKILDAGRFVVALDAFFSFGRCGGWIALGSTHFHFIREIPMLSWYEVHSNIGAWIPNGCTWSHASRMPPGKTKTLDPATSTEATTPAVNATPRVAVSQPTNSNGLDTPSASDHGSASNPEQVAAPLAARAGDDVENCVTLHCVAVSWICAKHGRIVVPPPVLLTCEAFSRSSPSSAAYSPSNPTHHMERREVWEDALGEEVEAQGVQNLKLLDDLGHGMEGAH
ncbi:hypothetical protein CONPUDRAFT_68535 [Coniophora puteana RWD-64-598 SS2]|uniref:Uncharacterized protein n=1 Tax=Coniophora puteana (strain RWD-64-598) TaxID=741705 RepID=A0A5M3N4V1_CONPW|nr:uncharacterized protein CONPUDRAFT_68535 [Coniophora puteana RWD-64-598 SS2]EIW85875.1 hypothetical protein CONPUDRAFT_68535 [Coniophora puteana RWD-64-598 SS2]